MARSGLLFPRGGRVLSDGQGFGYVAGVASGNLRLLLGMLRANRPWRLAIRLSRALVAALAAGVFALVTSDLWRLADGELAFRARLGQRPSGCGRSPAAFEPHHR